MRRSFIESLFGLFIAGLLFTGLFWILDFAIVIKTISIFALLYGVMGFIVYKIFITACNGRLTTQQLGKIFVKSMLISWLGICAIAILLKSISSLWQLTLVEPFMVFSPIVFTVLLFFTMQVSIPKNIKHRLSHPLRQSSQQRSHEEIVAQMEENMQDNIDPMNPIGLTNPSSPNYIERQHYH